MPRSFDAAIFDMDGTIVHTEPFHRRSWELSLAALGRNLDGLDYEATFSGRRGIEIWRDVFGLEPDDAARMVDDLANHFWDLAGGNLAPIQGLAAFLDRISDLPKALATSAIPGSARRTLAEMGLSDAFDVVVTAHDITRGKPDPEIFLVAAERLGVAPDRCIAFEDAPSGIAAARAAGMFCVGITTSRDAIAGADLLIAGYEDRRLLDLFEDLDFPSVR